MRRRRVPQYDKWNFAGTEELAETKSRQIARESFDTVDDYFIDHCKPLLPCLEELHREVFPRGMRFVNEHRELSSREGKGQSQGRDCRLVLRFKS